MPTTLKPEQINQTALVQQDKSNIVAGDVDIEQLSLVYYKDRHLTINRLLNSGGSIRLKDIIPRVQQIDLFYSIFTPVIYCELQCVDSVDDLHGSGDQDSSIDGEQYLYIQYKSPFLTTDQTTRLLLRVYAISDVSVSPTNRSRSYTIYATSPEAIDNAAVTVYRSLRSKSGDPGTSISDIVPRILSQDLKTTKPVDIEPTTGIVDQYLYNLYPLEAIDYLRHIATTANRSSGMYVFFEKADRYVFRTLEDLFEKGQSAGPVASYVFDTLGNTAMETDLYSRVLVYKQPTFVDNYAKIVSGGISNHVNSFDLITGKYSSITYEHSKSRTQNKYAEPADRGRNNSDQFLQQFSQGTYSKYIVEAATDRRSDLARKLANQQGYGLELAQNIVQISVYGNSAVTIGDVIDLSLIVPTSATREGDRLEQPTVTRRDSGNYLISKARETINVSSRPQLLQSFELIKGQFLTGRQI